jgi:tRNA nucleotidyltransferase (CCA-adding enzyme)
MKQGSRAVKTGEAMPDYIYLLENRLSADQQNALRQLREAAHEAGMILFLTGDAVRDLTSGHAVRDIEVAVHGNALKLKKTIEKLGGVVWGESEPSKTLFLCFPGTVRVDVVSTHRIDYTKMDKPVYHPASIQEDLRRRDFTVNAMAISLNEGSFGLLMDPLNGVADIEARTLRLVSNYGFLEDPSLLISATRYKTRLGWELEPRTQTRYENAKGEGVIERLSAEAQGRELEQIGHEDEGLKVLQALEDEGWMRVLFPAWTAAKADEEKLKALHDLAVELLLQGVHPDMSAAQMQLLTSKLAAKDLAALKKLLLRPGFVEEWNSLDAVAAKFAKVLLAKENATASAGFKVFTSYDPEAVLWLGFTSKDKAVQERFNQFLKVWPEARQRIPHALMQEMRITPELATYKEIVQAIFLELIDGKLTATEEMRAFLEPHSPPAPPPQVTVKRPRAKRGEAKVKERTYDDEESEDALDEDEDLDDMGGDDDEIDLGLSLPKADLESDSDLVEESKPSDDDLEADEADEPGPAKRGSKSAAVTAPSEPEKANLTGKTAGKSKAAPKADSQAAAVSPKVFSPAVKTNVKEPESRKDNKMSNNKVGSPTVGSTPLEDAKPPEILEAKEGTALTPGAKPPQATRTTEILAADPGVPLVPGAKPPQAVKRTSLGAKPTGALAPGAKPPQASKGRVLAAKATKPAAKKAAPVKSTAKKAAPVKAAAKKAAPAKKVAPAKKKSAPAKKKPVAKPVPKPKKKAAGPKAKKKAGKKR